MKTTALRILPRLLPAGALFLPLGTLTISLGALGELFGALLGGGTGTQYNIVKLIQALFSGDEPFANLLKADIMTLARPWLAVAAAGLALAAGAVLAGLALACGGGAKLLSASSYVYAGGALATAFAMVGFRRFSAVLAEATGAFGRTSLNFGAWVLLATLLLCAAICFSQWRAASIPPPGGETQE